MPLKSYVFFLAMVLSIPVVTAVYAALKYGWSATRARWGEFVFVCVVLTVLTYIILSLGLPLMICLFVSAATAGVWQDRVKEAPASPENAGKSRTCVKWFDITLTPLSRVGASIVDEMRDVTRAGLMRLKPVGSRTGQIQINKTSHNPTRFRVLLEKRWYPTEQYPDLEEAFDKIGVNFTQSPWPRLGLLVHCDDDPEFLQILVEIAFCDVLGIDPEAECRIRCSGVVKPSISEPT